MAHNMIEGRIEWLPRVRSRTGQKNNSPDTVATATDRHNSEPCFTHQIRQRHPERMRDFDQRKYCGVVIAAFDTAEIASVNLREQR